MSYYPQVSFNLFSLKILFSSEISFLNPPLGNSEESCKIEKNNLSKMARVVLQNIHFILVMSDHRRKRESSFKLFLWQNDGSESVDLVTRVSSLRQIHHFSTCSGLGWSWSSVLETSSLPHLSSSALDSSEISNDHI